MSNFKQGEKVWTLKPIPVLTVCPTCEQEWQRKLWEPDSEPYYVELPVRPTPDTLNPGYFLTDEHGEVMAFRPPALIFRSHEAMIKAYYDLAESERVGYN
jgi:hypothetical protein